MTISDYVQMANAIGNMKMKSGDASNEILIDTLRCALVYDFMAFIAQTLGYDKVYDIRRVQLLRRMLYQQLSNHVRDKFFMDQSLNVIFTYIIEDAIPVYDAQRTMLITETMHNDLNSRFPPKFIEPSQLTAETNAKSELRFTMYYFPLINLTRYIETNNEL